MKAKEEQYFGSKTLLLKEYELQLNARIISQIFGRVLCVLIILFSIVMEPLSLKSTISLLLTAGVLCFLWGIETWSREKTVLRLSNLIGDAEEDQFETNWEDAHIKLDYYRYSRLVFRFQRTFVVLEPWLWLFTLSASIAGFQNR